MLNIFKKTVLDAEQRSHWDQHGYLVLRNFFEPTIISAINGEVASLIENKDKYSNVTVDVLWGELVGKRMKLAETPAIAFDGPVKINDLFLESKKVRACNLEGKIVAIVGELLNGDPLICNSLNFLYGSTQAAHYDSWFMPPSVKDKMLAVSVCLDENTADNGPIFLYPGSHKIPPHVFPHGKIAKLDADLGPAIKYIQETTGHIEPVTFLGSPGDVLIWHGQLLHGGSPINDPRKTRRSLVTHYWRAKDVQKERRVKVTPDGYILKRDHQEVRT